MIRFALPVALLSLVAVSAGAQVVAPRASTGCVLLRDGEAKVQVDGRLSRQTFKGPTGKAERAFIVRLPARICVDDGGAGMADPSKRSDAVQVDDADARMVRTLSGLIGKRVTVIGNGMPAHTGHHFAPLVVQPEHIARR